MGIWKRINGQMKYFDTDEQLKLAEGAPLGNRNAAKDYSGTKVSEKSKNAIAEKISGSMGMSLEGAKGYVNSYLKQKSVPARLARIIRKELSK